MYKYNLKTKHVNLQEVVFDGDTYRVVLDYVLKDEIQKWLTGKKFTVRGHKIVFENKDDLLLFKLYWS